MSKKGIKVGSLTYAMKGRDILYKKGIKCEIKRQANNSNRLGCGFGVLTTSEGVRILEKSGIRILGIKEI